MCHAVTRYLLAGVRDCLGGNHMGLTKAEARRFMQLIVHKTLTRNNGVAAC